MEFRVHIGSGEIDMVRMQQVRSIRRWHRGKLLLLWVWAGLIAALLLTNFQTSKVESSPYAHAIELGAALVLLVSMSVVTWIWFGDREAKDAKSPEGEP